jgi:ABC-type dipeptide/oligopeptide/nickel transport system permease component
MNKLKNLLSFVVNFFRIFIYSLPTIWGGVLGILIFGTVFLSIATDEWNQGSNEWILKDGEMFASPNNSWLKNFADFIMDLIISYFDYFFVLLPVVISLFYAIIKSFKNSNKKP